MLALYDGDDIVMAYVVMAYMVLYDGDGIVMAYVVMACMVLYDGDDGVVVADVSSRRMRLLHKAKGTAHGRRHSRSWRM